MPSLCTARSWTLNAIVIVIYVVSCPVSAEDYFNLSVLETDTPLENTGALESYLRNNGLLPGRYMSTIMWDQQPIDKRNLSYVLSKDKSRLLPQLTKGQLRELGVRVEHAKGLNALADNDIVTDIADYLPDARYDFNPDTQTLHLRIPQIYRNAAAIGEINPQYWDDGVPALWTSYYLSGSQQSDEGATTQSHWASLNSGFNLGAWRLRNSSSWGDAEGWESINTTLQRDIKRLKSQLEMGQTYTSGELFDSVQMTGVKLETDTSMLPSSQQGFAPVVRGIANSEAKITIKQNGYTIYQSYVSAGPFEIHDLSQVTAGADLDVTVTEADGTERSFIQASSSVPILQREGALKYSLAAGRYRQSDNGEEPEFGQATAIYGLPYGVTVYGGLLGASMYRSGALGAGADLQRFGSLSVDFTAARTQFDDGRPASEGTSWRAQYAKDFPLTNTTVTLASYRYSTSGFYTFQEAIDQRSERADDDSFYSYRESYNRRSRLQINLSQAVGRWGSVYANAYQQDYWHLDGYERSVSMGYSNSWAGMNWSLNYSLTKTPSTQSDRQLALTLNIPLSGWLANTWASYSLNTTQRGSASHQVGINGTALKDNNLSYNLQQSYTDNNVGYGGYLSGRYRASVGEFSTSYGYQGDSRQLSYSAQGSVVAHPYGVTLGRSLQDAFAIVHIAEGDNINIQNSQGIYTDSWGNAIVPSLTRYRRNAITVNTLGRDDVDIQDAVMEVVPTKGAAVAANFVARAGKRALLTLKYGKDVVPFGAILSMENATAIVGDDGEVFITGLKGAQHFSVRWGNEPDNQCQGEVTIPAESKARVLQMTAICQ